MSKKILKKKHGKSAKNQNLPVFNQ